MSDCKTPQVIEAEPAIPYFVPAQGESVDLSEVEAGTEISVKFTGKTNGNGRIWLDYTITTGQRYAHGVTLVTSEFAHGSGLPSGVGGAVLVPLFVHVDVREDGQGFVTRFHSEVQAFHRANNGKYAGRVTAQGRYKRELPATAVLRYTV